MNGNSGVSVNGSDKDVFIDGSFSCGVGGWAVAVVDGEEVHYTEVESGKVPTSYSSEMEGFILALKLSISVFESLGTLHVHTDSQAIIDGYQERVINFSENENRSIGNIKTNSDKARWKYVRSLVSGTRINFIKVKSHSGNVFNDLVDRLAKNARTNQTNWVERTSQRLRVDLKKRNDHKLDSQMKLLRREFEFFISDNNLCDSLNLDNQSIEEIMSMNKTIHLAFLCWCGAKGVASEGIKVLKEHEFDS